ncbi:hypothetical protein DICPUDRAFT_148373 [Dictyostelium purpureum]|uniref:Uncharacterized protein n=1 Tax=Dictyostelium purpureum TaxID=5786 RepID=F0ZAY6_DICPU|nr:uncharacterized protein DICPUDRAFT_148373 [Dictyostelium purpureum]EGC38911.1 hypothetical protein DICPUDRAFT_148373 [Dictyostelium purpureum]|eukprot:XP_003284591.1 hypothetical protein DICPUDRAFT_148373 [Dictyostelium purpureum]
MNKILSFKKKFIYNNNNNNSDNNKSAKQTFQKRSPHNITKLNDGNDNDDPTILNRKKVKKTPYIKPPNTGSVIVGAPLCGLFSKGKKSSEISNNRKTIQPFSEEGFLDQKPPQQQQQQQQGQGQGQHSKSPTKQKQNKPLIHNQAVTNHIYDKTKPSDISSETNISFNNNNNKININIDKLIEDSKDEYNQKVKEIEKKVLSNTVSKNNTSNDPKIQATKMIISIEKEMISLLDLMINDQNNNRATFKNIVGASKKLSNHNFFNFNNNK